MSARSATHWPDGPAMERARDAIGHVAERAAETRNTHHVACSTCGRELSTRWRRVSSGVYLCAACVVREPGPDREALDALGIRGDVTTMGDDEWTRSLIAALADRRQRGARR